MEFYVNILLRHYVASRKVANSIHDYVIGFLNSSILFSHAMTQGFTEHIRKIGTGAFLGTEALRESKADNAIRGPWSASELYRLSDRHFSTKFSANFCG
jgi:hypothetical protein